MNIKQALSHTLLNLPGGHACRKIVVIESDDWKNKRISIGYFFKKY